MYRPSHASLVLYSNLLLRFLQLLRLTGSSTALRKMGYFYMRVNLVFTSIRISSRISFRMTLLKTRCSRMYSRISGKLRKALKVCSLTLRLLLRRSIISRTGYSSMRYSKKRVSEDSVRQPFMRLSQSCVMCFVCWQAGGDFSSSWYEIRWVYW
jgi:hypothetical protein